MKKRIETVAIIGPTGSGKSSLAIELADRHDAFILSLDSLSIYKKIDIASAKPSRRERRGIPHFGIDVICPDDPFSVIDFMRLYKTAYRYALEREKNMIIVGGSSFYLKALLDGISPLPEISGSTVREVEELMKDPEKAYGYLKESAPEYSSSISAGDSYRIEKALLIYIETGMAPDIYFKMNPPIPVIPSEISLFEIDIERDSLRKRVEKRTKTMLKCGLVDEVAGLEHQYGRLPRPMKAIGIREVLDYFDGIYGFDKMEEKIVTNTMRFAKRQSTFNRSQFSNIRRTEAENLKKEISQILL